MSDNSVRIAHISDLHFGADGYKDVSKVLAEHLRDNVKPHMVIVSGDLVDTPKDALFDEVFTWREGLNVSLGCKPGEPSRYVVCAGNHDRHKRGNALPWRFPKYNFEKVFTANKSSYHTMGWCSSAPLESTLRIGRYQRTSPLLRSSISRRG